MSTYPWESRPDGVGVQAVGLNGHEMPSESLDRSQGEASWINRMVGPWRVQRDVPWRLQILCVAAFAVWNAPLAVALCASLVPHRHGDWFVLVTGLLVGVPARSVVFFIWARLRPARALALFPIVSKTDWLRRLGNRPAIEGWREQFAAWRRDRSAIGAGVARVGTFWFWVGRVVACFAWTVGAFVPALVVSLAFHARLAGTLAGELSLLLLLLAAAWLGAHTVSHVGRTHLRAVWRRMIRHEYWPAWLFYAPVYPQCVALGVTSGGIMTPSCCNPGIENGGGLVGESKHAIMRALARHAPAELAGTVLTTLLVESGPDPRTRATCAEGAMKDNGLAYPVIVKPDKGQRGHAVKVVGSREELEDYFRTMRAGAVIQPYHPGPEECGVLWVRRPGGKGAAGANAGSVFSITVKRFPRVVGDGERTLEELVMGDARLRCQARVFLTRCAGRASEVVRAGEVVRLALSGNHCQGTMFEDGEHLRSPELEAAIDRLARMFPDASGAPGGLDFGRFDIRYESDETLRRGTGFAIVELNGTFSESTNMYDPSFPLSRSWGILRRQWSLLYRLGAERKGAGVRPMGLWELIEVARAHTRERDGSVVAD